MPTIGHAIKATRSISNHKKMIGYIQFIFSISNLFLRLWCIWTAQSFSYVNELSNNTRQALVLASDAKFTPITDHKQSLLPNTPNKTRSKSIFWWSLPIRLLHGCAALATMPTRAVSQAHASCAWWGARFAMKLWLALRWPRLQVQQR